MKRIALLAIAALLALPAAAAETDEELAWRAEERDLSVQGTASGFGFTSARRSDLGADTFTGGFDSPAARLTTDLLAAEPASAHVRMEIAWTALVEYRDADRDGLYGLADETVQEVAIPGLPQQTVVAPSLGGGQTATVTYTLPENASQPGPVVGLPSRGTFRLAFTLVEATAATGGSVQHPTDLRLRAEVRDFPFQAGDTRLALVAEVATDAAALEPTDAGLAASSGGHSWSAAWSPRVRTDGIEAFSGVSSLASDAAHATAVLSLPRGDEVSQEGTVSAHFGSVGEVLRSLPPGDWRFYALGLAGAAVALGVPSVRRLKER